MTGIALGKNIYYLILFIMKGKIRHDNIAHLLFQRTAVPRKVKHPC